MAIVESTTIDGPLRPCVCNNSSQPGVTSAVAVATKPLLGPSTATPADTSPSAPAVPTLAPRRMTVGYIGPNVPYLRMQGWWLDRAGFGVGTPVRVQVSEGRLIVEAVEQTGIPGRDKPTYLHDA